MLFHHRPYLPQSPLLCHASGSGSDGAVQPVEGVLRGGRGGGVLSGAQFCRRHASNAPGGEGSLRGAVPHPLPPGNQEAVQADHAGATGTQCLPFVAYDRSLARKINLKRVKNKSPVYKKSLTSSGNDVMLLFAFRQVSDLKLFVSRQLPRTSISRHDVLCSFCHWLL